MVAREVQCDGRMAMEIKRARVQNRLHPLMVSVPESVPVAVHGVEEKSLWCCSIRLEMEDVGDGDEKASSERRRGIIVVRNEQKRDFPEPLCLWVEKTPVRDELGQTSWTKKNNIDILLSSLTVNALYCTCLSYCFIVQ